ncbi:transposase [Burkholderia sp. WAC0059]|uniref:winged helix-turn-helix domain-containing protein n=1 Tax=Burkholderia sp. WAC0059 TaxID=2066022 RepID=UPI000C7EB799|nr:winged helix-turn-helix domain-containing protein [Burkholderia sp. WAC0059]PLZ00051.1 transposase [Burkholderia sp. WAC0059]
MSEEMGKTAPRRMRAGHMLLAGKPPEEVARETGAALQSVRVYERVLNDGGIEALSAMGNRGRLPKLNNSAYAWLNRALLETPNAHGFAAKNWTQKTLSDLIAREFGIRFSKSHVSRILRALRTPEKTHAPLPAARRIESGTLNWKRNYPDQA